MRALRLLILLSPLAIAGCLSVSSSNPNPPAHNTVVVPACGTAGAPPC